MDNRLHNSLPALDIEYLPEVRHRSYILKRKKGRQLEDEALTNVLSVFYAKILVIMGVAFSITRSLTTESNSQHDIYYIYLYLGSILFLLYMYMIHSRTRSIIYEISNVGRPGTNDVNLYRRLTYARYGSFYFRMGVVGFGVGSLIYSTLQLSQYFEFDHNQSCVTLLRVFKPATRIGFILLQMLFIFSLSNFLAVQKSQFVAKFGLMHLIATNISDWFQVLIEQTILDLSNSVASSLRHNHSDTTHIHSYTHDNRIIQVMQQNNDRLHNCLKSKIIAHILYKIDPHLASCAVEYNLLCAMILIIMWKSSTCGKNNEASRDLSTEISRQSGSNVIYGRSQSQFSVDCAQTQRGLFSGILVLAITIIVLILFFELMPYEDKMETAILQMNIWEGILFMVATMAVFMCMIKLRDIKMSNKNLEIQLEHLLLLVTQFGVFMYFLFQVIGVCLMSNRDLSAHIRILSPILAVLQSCSQTAFILDTWRRRCSTEAEMKQKPGRQLITFLLLVNVSLWVINRVKNNRSEFHPNQMNFYGILAWNIITHVSMPLVVSYRFQATVCFYEIWKHVYKRPVNTDSSNNHEEEG